MKNRVAFTLPQLLVSVAVGSILAIAILPDLQSDRENLRRAICANNLRQIGQAMIMYSDDFRGSFPTGPVATDLSNSAMSILNSQVGVSASPPGNGNVGGLNAFARYLVKKKYVPTAAVFVCPSDKISGSSKNPVYVAQGTLPFPQPWQNIGKYSGGFNISYFYVARMTTQLPGKSGAATTNRVYMLMADRANTSSHFTPDLQSDDNHGTDGRNVLFTDSHVEWISGPVISNLMASIQQDWGAYGIDNCPGGCPQVTGQDT